MEKSLNIAISGKVQNVGFRWAAKKQAAALNLRGFARNRPDGILYIEAEGEDADLEKFLDWCKNGPAYARVKSVRAEEGPVKRFKGFEIAG